MMKCQYKNPKRHIFLLAHPSVSETIPSDVPVASVEPEDSVQTTSTRHILFKRPPSPLDRVEPPKSSRCDEDDHSALLSAYHHDLEKVSENLKNGKSVFSGTGMPDMLVSARLVIKVPAGTSESETLTEARSVEPLQKDVDIFVGHSQGTQHVRQIFCGRGGITSRDLTVCVDENALGCDVQR